MSLAQISLIRRTFKTIGATFPKPVSDGIADLDTLDAAGALQVPGSEKLYDAAAEAVLAGRDPLADRKVTSIITAQILAGTTGQGFHHGLNQAGYRRLVGIITDHADDITATLKDSADSAGAILASSYDILGDLELDESELILSKGPDAASAWAAAKVALQTIREVEAAWFSLADLTGFTSASLDPTLRLADLDLNTIQQVGRKADAWTIVKAGGTISLATRTTAKERAKAYTAALEARTAHDENAYARGWKQMNGFQPAT